MSNTDKPFRFEGEENFISGIYNYCDRWCERCSFTLRCEVFARDNEGPDDPESHDINNAKFWHKLEGIFREAREMISQLAEEHGVDLKDLETNETIEQHEQQLDEVENHELARAATVYAERVGEWFQENGSLEEFDDFGTQSPPFEDSIEAREAAEVICWYQHQIAVKIMRGLMGAADEKECVDEIESEIPKDSDGSIKVALIAIDRSLSAWRIMQMEFPERAASIVDLLIALDGLRQATDRAFPEARDFIRPGFDEISDELIN